MAHTLDPHLGWDIMRGGPAFPRGTAAVSTPRYHAAIGLGLLLELRIGF